MKRWIPFLLVLSMLTGVLCGCGREPSGNQTAPTTTPASTASTAATSASTTSATTNPATSASEPSSAGQSTGATSGTPAGTLKTLLAGKPALSDELVEAFFLYYRENPLELRLLPTFPENGMPDWDGLTHFIYSNSPPAQRASGKLTSDQFDALVKTYFGKLDYTPKSSGFLEYAQGTYTPVGWDDNGAVLYRLRALSVDESGVYTADFDGFLLDESDFVEPGDYLSPNMKALLKASGAATPPSENVSEWLNQWALTLLLKDDYAQIMTVSETVTVRFILSGSEDTMGIYRSCERRYNS